MLLRALFAILLTLSGPVAYVFAYWVVPAVRMRDAEWWRSAPRAERILMCRRALSSPIGSHHDAALEVAKLGDYGAVPHLIDSLRWQTAGFICGHGHSLSALRKLTGANPGDSYEAWARWWEEHKP